MTEDIQSVYQAQALAIYLGGALVFYLFLYLMYRVAKKEYDSIEDHTKSPILSPKWDEDTAGLASLFWPAVLVFALVLAPVELLRDQFKK